MKKQILTTLTLLAISPMSSVYAAEPINLVKPVVPDSTKTNDVSTEKRVANPFTGNVEDYDKNVRELRLAKQRRLIAEAKLGEQSALSQISKLKDPSSSMQGKPFVPVAAAGLVPSVGPLPSRSVARTGTTQTVKPPANINSTAILQGPRLIGVTESSGKKYALFESNGKGLSIAEGETMNGISIGAINAGEVIVNGVPKRVVVGAQEIEYDSDSDSTVSRRVNGVATATAFNPANNDMTRLRLPTVNEPKVLTGPQPLQLPSNLPTY